jgi:murein DD-endopeptidase MepM/ murein hydrolase activator NlpD
LYGHASELYVGIGEQVRAGDTIAAAGDTGLATGPHLHFEVRILGTPVDPAPYL